MSRIAELIRARSSSRTAYVTELVQDKDTTIRRLRQLFFGSRHGEDRGRGRAEKTWERSTGHEASPDAAAGHRVGCRRRGDPPIASRRRRPRRVTAATAPRLYRGAVRIDVRTRRWRAGDACPACGEGICPREERPRACWCGSPASLRWRRRFIGCRSKPLPPVRPGLHRRRARRCRAEQVRRHGRQHDRPVEVRQRALPFNCLDGLAGDLGVPPLASTQWDVVEAVAGILALVFDELIRQAGQGELLHNDDTTVKDPWS